MLCQRQSPGNVLKRKSKQGDWTCIKCFNYNYSFRQYCNRCRAQQRNENQRLLNAIGKENYAEHSFPSVLFLQYPQKHSKFNPPQPFRPCNQKVIYVEKPPSLNDQSEQNQTSDDIDSIFDQNIWISNLIGE